jgi:membrane-associated HD superfamily phosphohydrolase
MKNLRINNIKDIEKALWIFYKRLPYPSHSASKKLTTIFPYISIVIAGYLLSIAILPFIFTSFPLDPLQNTGLYNFNLLLSRLLFILMATILIVSFERLSQRSLIAWYNLFFISLFHVFMVLVIFNMYSFLALLIFWYLLFSIKPHFS